MIFAWLKPYMPRSLYGRAAMILILPVVTLQLVVSIVFIQRHFEGVTQQMTQNISGEIGLLLGEIEAGAEVAELERLAGALHLRLRWIAPDDLPKVHQRRWYDFSGLVVIRTLRDIQPEVTRVQMPDDRIVRLYVATQPRALEITLDRRRVSASNPHQLLVTMVVFGALMTVIAFIYLRNQLRPITRLASVAEAFGRGRHEAYRPAGAVEVRAAGNAFLDMRSRIERQIEQRTMMLSGVSHDLRTPLTRMKLGLSMLDEEDRAPLERDVLDMQRLLDEFLSFARGAVEGEAEPIDPAELLRQVVADSQRAEISVRLGPLEGEGTVPLRPIAIRRAVENLINNAVRYGAQAQVSMTLSDKSLRIRVEDDGPGIPADQREEAIKPFARLDTARNQDRGTGVGLGLAIATDIARAHGGTLRLSDSIEMGGLCADIVIAR